jgi:hypothetical protein
MRDVIYILVGLIFVLFGLWLVAPAPAQCQWCYQGPCIDSVICGDGCRCMKKGIDLEGSCYGS